MNTAVKKNLTVKPLVAAVALACSAGAALAAPPPFAVPGAGLITAVNPGTTFVAPAWAGNYTVNGGGTKGGQVYNGQSSAIFSLPFPPLVNLEITNAAGNAYGVIRWGGNGASPETLNAQGFNVGQSAVMSFSANVPGGSTAAVLNIDASGFPSQIMGGLISCAPGVCLLPNTTTYAPKLFVSNATGIIQGPQSLMVLPNGGGLLGADMNSATQMDEFIANNSGAGAGSYIDLIGGLAPVTVQGFLAGNLSASTPAPGVLIAGGNIVNSGNLFTGDPAGFFALALLDAGMTAVASKHTVNLVANTSVQRFWNVDAQNIAWTVPDLGVPGGLQIGLAGASVVNTGSLNGKNGQIGLVASAGIRSGTLGSIDPSVGIFTDLQPFFFNYTAGTSVELYNTIRGFSTNTTLPGLQINTNGTEARVPGTAGDVFIQANTIGTDPSSITTTGPVYIAGDNITINSTINHKLNSAGGVQADVDLWINASKSVTINKDIGAGHDVIVIGKGAILIAGNVLSDTNKGGLGGIFITNNGTAALNTTTISGNLSTATTSVDDIEIINNGLANSDVIITGNITTNQSADAEVFSKGNLHMSGTVLGANNVFLTSLGSQIVLGGPITANNDPQGLGNNGVFGIAAPVGTVQLKPAALITAPTALFGYDDSGWFAGPWVGVNNVQGVNAAGLRYATLAEKPATQIVTNNLVWMGFGSFNAPWGTNSNWITNQIEVDPLVPSLPVSMSLSGIGAGPQFVNIGSKGDVWLDSGITLTPFQFTTGIGGEGFGIPIGNGGSSLIVKSAQSMQVMSNSGAQGSSFAGGPGFLGGGGNSSFAWPGGIALIAGNTLSQFLPIWNAWTILAVEFQGIWLEAPTIFALGFYAINGNSRVNFSTMPVNGIPLVYRLIHPDPINYAFEQVLDRAFLNTYTKAITGTPINNCPIGFTC